jgi:hypothetical protein
MLPTSDDLTKLATPDLAAYIEECRQWALNRYESRHNVTNATRSAGSKLNR